MQHLVNFTFWRSHARSTQYQYAMWNAAALPLCFAQPSGPFGDGTKVIVSMDHDYYRSHGLPVWLTVGPFNLVGRRLV